MFRAAPRLIAQPALRTAPLRSLAPARRYISTAPPAQKRRSFKSLVARVGIAGAIIYYYNTTDVFAEEPRQLVQPLPETEVESEHLPTIESISEERKRRQAVQAQLEAQKQKEAASAQQNAQPASGAEGDIGGLEEEADQQGAFNPETGEINWDCPCLGGMAHGPCGEQFKAAFSCFVYSKEEPKGMDCIDKFKDMQNCFREHPDVYGSELDADDDNDEAELADTNNPATTQQSDSTSTYEPPTSPAKPDVSLQPSSAGKVRKGQDNNSLVPDNYKPNSYSHNPTFDARGDMSALDSQQTKKETKVEGGDDTQRVNRAKEQVKEVSESERVVPKAAHDREERGTERLERK